MIYMWRTFAISDGIQIHCTYIVFASHAKNDVKHTFVIECHKFRLGNERKKTMRKQLRRITWNRSTESETVYIENEFATRKKQPSE